MRPLTMTLPVLLALAACNQPPEGLGITLEPAAPSTLDDLTLTIGPEAVDPNKGDVVQYRYNWTADGAPQDNDTNTVLSGETNKGQVWTVEVSPWDGKLIGPPIEASVTILNTPPTAEVSVTPSEPTTNDDVQVEVDARDIDNDKLTLRYQWKLNGSVTSLTNDTLRANRTNKGEVWEVSVYPNDGEEDGEPAVATITIANTAPEVASAEVRADADPATAASTLTCAGRGWTDVDDDAEDYRVRWFVNGAEVSTTATLAGAFVRDDKVACELTPFDGEDAGDPVMSKDIIVRNAPPTVDAVVIGPEDPVRTDTVRAKITGGVDLDGDAITYRYSWRVDAREAASTEELPSSRFKRDQSITLVLTPTDGFDDGPIITSNEVFGGNNVPEITKLTVTPDPLYTDSLAEATVVYEDFDGDEVSLVVEWYKNGSKISATTASIDGKSWFERGDKLYVVASPDDGADTGKAVTSVEVTVANSPPTMPVLVLDPASPKTGEDVQCKIDKASVDADEDKITYFFEWEVNGKVVPGDTTTYTGDTLSADDWTEGSSVYCYVTPNDGRDDGPVASKNFGIYKGMTGTYGVTTGKGWIVCRVGGSDAWFAANSGGTYKLHDICKKYGYTKGADKWGGTCGTVCGYCGTKGREYYDGGGLSGTLLRTTVHWRCAR